MNKNKKLVSKYDNISKQNEQYKHKSDEYDKHTGELKETNRKCVDEYTQITELLDCVNQEKK